MRNFRSEPAEKLLSGCRANVAGPTEPESFVAQISVRSLFTWLDFKRVYGTMQDLLRGERPSRRRSAAVSRLQFY